MRETAPSRYHVSKLRFLLLFTAAFIVCTAVGTVSHEGGHIAVARILGYETSLSHASMNWDHDTLRAVVDAFYQQYPNEIRLGLDFPGKSRFTRLREQLKTDGLWISMGGPAQTTLTGSLGLWLLYTRKKSLGRRGLRPFDWASVFLALFWLRETFNLTMSVCSEFLAPDGRFFGGDEAGISRRLALPIGTVPIAFGATGLAVLLFVLFVVVPKPLRAVFIAGGLAGGGAGYFLWMYLLGPYLLP